MARPAQHFSLADCPTVSPSVSRARLWRGGHRQTLRRSVDGLVRGLGCDPRAIAGSLDSEGIKGLTGNSNECAIARYLKAVVGSEATVVGVFVTERHIKVTRRFRSPILLSLPPAARAFVREFDAGGFPTLIDEKAMLAQSPQGAPQ
jgi:hypothetical protein